MSIYIFIYHYYTKMVENWKILLYYIIVKNQNEYTSVIYKYIFTHIMCFTNIC